MTVKHITDFLENKYPLSLQESYDNCGLTYGYKQTEIKGVLISLDVTEKIVEEAIRKNCNLIISHHPVIFKGLKRINGSNMSERVIELCIKNEIALYAIHTNIDNHKEGVNKRIADKMGVELGVMDIQLSAKFDRRGTMLEEEIDVPFSSVTMDIEIDTDATEEQMNALKTDLAKFCPIAKVLRGSGVKITENWIINSL